MPPALIALGWTRPKTAVGLSAPFILGNSITGLISVLISGQTIVQEFPVFAVAALLGAAVGSALAFRFSDKVVRLLLAVIVSFAGIRLLTRWLHRSAFLSRFGLHTS